MFITKTKNPFPPLRATEYALKLNWNLKLLERKFFQAISVERKCSDMISWMYLGSLCTFTWGWGPWRESAVAPF